MPLPIRVKQIEKPPSAAKIGRNLDFGVALGLTDTAKEGQKASVGALKGTFTLRGGWWQQQNKFGIKVKAAKKTDLAAEVGTRADWLEPHETGKTKTARGGGNVAIPLEGIRRKGSTQKIAKRLKPRNLKRTFVIKTKSGPVLFQRVTNYAKHQGPTMKGKVTRRRTRMGTDIRPVYAFERSVRIRKQSTFYEPIRKVVNRRLDTNIARGVRRAFATMR
jgi:hypothetical protein